MGMVSSKLRFTSSSFDFGRGFPVAISSAASFRNFVQDRPGVVVLRSACVLEVSRVFSGVITGIDFLGAGAMFREDSYVKGAGSAASIWAAGAIGLICGIGLLWLAALLATGVLIVLIVSAPFIGKYDAK